MLYSGTRKADELLLKLNDKRRCSAMLLPRERMLQYLLFFCAPKKSKKKAALLDQVHRPTGNIALTNRYLLVGSAFMVELDQLQASLHNKICYLRESSPVGRTGGGAHLDSAFLSIANLCVPFFLWLCGEKTNL